MTYCELVRCKTHWPETKQRYVFTRLRLQASAGLMNREAKTRPHGTVTLRSRFTASIPDDSEPEAAIANCMDRTSNMSLLGG